MAGAVLGFFGSVPVAGPVAVVVAARGLHGDVRGGRAVAIGAGLAEGALAGLVFAGMGWIVTAVPALRATIRWVGVAVLIGVGIWFVVRGAGSPPGGETAEPTGGRPLQDGLLGVGMVAGNVGMIGTWSAAVAVLEGTGWVQARAEGAGGFAVGVALGVIGWFALLLWAIDRWRGALRHSVMNAGIRLVGGALVGLGLVEGGRLLAG